MKKFFVLLVVLALVGLSSVALAADVTLGGSVQVRSRDFSNLSLDKTVNKDQVDTQERIMIDINAKADKVSGKISLWNDFNDWGGASGGYEKPLGVGFGNSTSDGGAFGFREAWILFPVADTGFTIKTGHQLLQLGDGWFFRSQHFGSDAWVAFRDDGPNHLGFVNVKVAEVTPAKANDDIDAYVIVDTYKISDDAKVGIDVTFAKDRGGNLGFGGPVDAQNIGLNFTGKVGPVNLKAELDLQMGKIKTFGTATVASEDMKLKGNDLAIRGNVPVSDALTINFLVGRGTGQKIDSTSKDINQFLTFLDVDPHYTFLYEYKLASRACYAANGNAGVAHAGLCNTTALSVGAMFAASKSVNVGADIYLLQSTEKIQDYKKFIDSGDASGTTNAIGNEIDVKVNWKLSDNLAWNWDLGMFMPGAGMGKDTATGIQGILAFKF